MLYDTIVIGVKLLCVFLDYIGELCAFDKDVVPHIYSIYGDVPCVVSVTQTCEKVYLEAEYFTDNPSFSCKVVVSVGTLMTL